MGRETRPPTVVRRRRGGVFPPECFALSAKPLKRRFVVPGDGRLRRETLHGRGALNGLHFQPLLLGDEKLPGLGLTAGEMLGQVIAVNRDEGGSVKQRRVAKLVLMGSGEPFDNYDNVLKFLDAVSDEKGINIGERNISLSTSGLCDKIVQFADSGHKVTLSISLHAPFDELRTALMPVNKAYGIDKIVAASRYYFQKTGRRVIFEYTLISGQNDSDECARQLAKITSGFPSHVNLIRLNEVKENDYIAPTVDATEQFLHKLEALGVSATIRRSLGGDIDGACGQLRRRYIEEANV